MNFVLLAATLAGLNSGAPDHPVNGNAPAPVRLAECPQKPNCVSSETRDAGHAVAPMQLKGDPVAAWDGIRVTISRLPRCVVVRFTSGYLHATCKSRVFGFVDDLELLRDAATDRVAIRSAARTGYSDLGVNRKRVEKLRKLLRVKALID